MIYLLTLSKKLLTATLLVLIFFTLNANTEETTVAPQAPAWQLKIQSGDTISSEQLTDKRLFYIFRLLGVPIAKYYSPNKSSLQKNINSKVLSLLLLALMKMMAHDHKMS